MMIYRYQVITPRGHDNFELWAHNLDEAAEKFKMEYPQEKDFEIFHATTLPDDANLELWKLTSKIAKDEYTRAALVWEIMDIVYGEYQQ